MALGDKIGYIIVYYSSVFECAEDGGEGRGEEGMTGHRNSHRCWQIVLAVLLQPERRGDKVRMRRERKFCP